jgi:hypothetical protein
VTVLNVPGIHWVYIKTIDRSWNDYYYIAKPCDCNRGEDHDDGDVTHDQ